MKGKIHNRPPRKLAYAECRKILAIGYDDNDGGLASFWEEDDAFAKRLQQAVRISFRGGLMDNDESSCRRFLADNEE